MGISAMSSPPIADTGWLSVAAVSPWPGTFFYRKLGQIVYLSYIGTPSAAYPAASLIATLPVGFRPDTSNNYFVSIFSDAPHEINVHIDGTVSANKAGSAGITIWGSFPVTP